MRNGTLLFIAFIGIFYAVGLGMLGYGLWSIKRSTEAGSWPTVPGRIVACSMKESSDSDGSTYQVQVEYAYKVAGVDYTNDRLAFGYSLSSGYEVHREILEKLQKAQTVEVRYDPGDPQTAVLSYGIHRSIQFVMAFAVTWLAFVIGFTLIWWVASRSDNVLLQNLLVR